MMQRTHRRSTTASETRRRGLPARLAAAALALCVAPFELACGFTITSVSPGVASVGQIVTIQGSGFGSVQGTSTVLFGGTPAGMAVTWSDTTITVAVPSGARTGSVAVKVGALTSNPVPFIASAPAKSGLPLPVQLKFPAEVFADLAASTRVPTKASEGAGGNSSNSSQSTVAVADFDEDGDPDLVTGNQRWVCMFPNTGGGLSEGHCTSVASAGNFVGGLGVGDFNGDHHLDLAYAAGVGANGVIAIQLGDGAGGFGSPIVSGYGYLPHEIVVDDWNGDGHPDIASLSQSTLIVLSGNGSGGFGQVTYGVGAGARAIGSGDLNGDHRTDLVVSNGGNTSGVPGDLSILLNTGSGFAPEYRVATDPQPAGLVVQDLNGDGKTDVAVAHNTVFGTNNVVIFRGNGLGQLTRGQSIEVPSSVDALASADLNGDGLVDLLASGAELLHSLLGYGDGTFLRVDTRSAHHGIGLAVADFNEDGRADFFVEGNGSSLVLGDGSGHFAAPDFPIVSSGSTAVLAVRKGDLNEDGQDDLAVLESDQSTGKLVLDLLSAPGGAFARTTIPLTTAYSSTGAETLSVGDFDGDGHLDLVIQAQVNFVFQLLTFRGDGHGGFSAWASTDLPSASQTLAVGALNADTKSDVVLSFAPPARTEIWHATGVGTFGTPQTLAAGSIPITLEGLAVGRLNGDSRPDIVYADWG
ncbi:MAG: VCBS repeat-containing protein [Deltaproteobacteria bacterium]|nr:VCBS repeat-containing protein [Deltaproteobacteria bacterium]